MSPTTPKIVTFRSSDENLHLVQDPQTQHMDNAGRPYTVAGTRHEFRGGVLEVDEAENPEQVKWLRNHRLLNAQYGGFYEVGNEPDRPKPEVTEVVNAIVAAGLAGNAKEVRDILQGERDSHNRVEVVTVGESTLTALGYGEDNTEEAAKVAPEPTTGSVGTGTASKAKT